MANLYKVYRNRVYQAFQSAKLGKKGFTMPGKDELQFAFKYDASVEEVIELIQEDLK